MPTTGLFESIATLLVQWIWQAYLNYRQMCLTDVHFRYNMQSSVFDHQAVAFGHIAKYSLALDVRRYLTIDFANCCRRRQSLLCIDFLPLQHSYTHNKMLLFFTQLQIARAWFTPVPILLRKSVIFLHPLCAQLFLWLSFPKLMIFQLIMMTHIWTGRVTKTRQFG